MFDKIIYISDDGCNIRLKENAEVTMNLMNLHLIFEDDTKKIMGEVDDLDGNILKARFLGEIVGDRLIGGTIRKPSLDAKIRVIDKSEIPLITGSDTTGFMKLGVSPFYDGFPVYLDVNNFFSNHFAIFGNTGSGKSCGTSRLFQNMFHDSRLNPYKANIVIFDSSGEYYNAFRNLNQINPQYNYRFISTNEVEGIGEKLRLPIYLLNKDDLALLLQCTSHSQLPIIERMLKLALVFSQNDVDANAYKNHLIAKAITTILYTNETAPNKRNEIFSILASCSTDEFNLEAPVQGIGYVRKFKECFLIDNSGNFTESVLMGEYLDSFIKDEYDNYEPHTGVFYDLNTLEKALNFTLISEGWLRNEQTYGDSVTVRVRLHALIVGDNAKYFDVQDYVSLESYLSSLVLTEGRKYQIVNINLNDIDDDFAKVLTKIYSRLIFDFCKGLKNRASIPFHIILEEAHRYIQSDHDRFLFGYNIFERIAKEGRKYGVILGIITQRPVELSDNVISQCTNFLIFKINHPMDIDYIRKTIPHITDDIIEKQKSLQAGTCLGFGLGFKIPLIVRMEMPDPSPLSGNCDVLNIWSGKGGGFASGPAESIVPSLGGGTSSPAIPTMPQIPTSPSVPSNPSIPTMPSPISTSSGNGEKFDDSFLVTDNASDGNNNPIIPTEATPAVSENSVLPTEVNSAPSEAPVVSMQAQTESSATPTLDSLVANKEENVDPLHALLSDPQSVKEGNSSNDDTLNLSLNAAPMDLNPSISMEEPVKEENPLNSILSLSPVSEQGNSTPLINTSPVPAVENNPLSSISPVSEVATNTSSSGEPVIELTDEDDSGNDFGPDFS